MSSTTQRANLMDPNAPNPSVVVTRIPGPILSVDEQSQIQALDRTQPSLPMKKGRAGTMTHDYIRNGTTTLFAAMNVLDGTVIGQCMRHRHQEFIRFLNRLKRDIPAGELVHVVLDNYGSHKHPKVRAWLSRHPRPRVPSVRLIHIDNPFGYYEKETFADEVSLKPLFDLEKIIPHDLDKLN